MPKDQARLNAFATEGHCSACLLEKGLFPSTAHPVAPPLSHFGDYELIQEIDSDGQPHVTDFGLARQITPGSELTQTGQILGSPSHMSPEQAAARPTGPSTDVYALGAILYELLTGRPPFAAATPNETLTQVLTAEPVAPRLLNPAILRDLETICVKCLDKEPGRRS